MKIVVAKGQGDGKINYWGERKLHSDWDIIDGLSVFSQTRLYYHGDSPTHVCRHSTYQVHDGGHHSRSRGLLGCETRTNFNCDREAAGMGRRARLKKLDN